MHRFTYRAQFRGCAREEPARKKEGPGHCARVLKIAPPATQGITFLQVRTGLSANSSFYKLVLQALANN